MVEPCGWAGSYRSAISVDGLHLVSAVGHEKPIIHLGSNVLFILSHQRQGLERTVEAMCNLASVSTVAATFPRAVGFEARADPRLCILRMTCRHRALLPHYRFLAICDML